MRPELSGLNGGRKQFWLRQHRREIDRYYAEHGPEATMKEFNLRQPTLERFLSDDRRSQDDKRSRLSQADKHIMEFSRQGLAELRGRIRRIEDWQIEVQPVIDVGRSLIVATMQNIEIKSQIPTLPADPLSLAQLSTRSEK